MPQRLPLHPGRKWCSVCSRPGHHADQCYDFQLYQQDNVLPSEVRNYERIYPEPKPPIDNSHSTPYSMFENPRENFKFVWNVNESSDRVYGRFMHAANIQRDPEDDVRRTKGRKKAKKPKSNEQMVLNPMNEENIREKPKKQFAKNFYEDSAQTVQSQTLDVPESGAALNGETTEMCVDNDVEMKELEPKQKQNDALIVEPSDVDKLMQEAIEVDQLRTRSKSFSFCRELDELSKSKTTFNLSFIGTADDEEQPPIDDSPMTTKTNARQLREEAEIERLTEMEISLNKLKDQLTKNKTNDSIVLNVTNEQSFNSVHDSDSNYSFGDFFTETKSKRQKKSNDRGDAETVDYIPLPSIIDSPPESSQAADDIPSSTVSRVNPVNSAKVFLTKEHARLLLSTESGNKLLSDASNTHQVRVRMDWENLGNVLIIVGSTANQNKFHAYLIQFLVEMCKKVRIKNETFQQIPRSKVALIRFIRDQFALLEQPLGNVHELHKSVLRNESLKSKNGTKNADRARKNLNIILMGRAGLRDGRLHLAGLELKLKFLLENNKDMMTKHTREEIYQHYRYIFSSFEHDNYPDLITQYEELKRAKSFPALNIDKSLLEIKISVKDDASVDLNQAKQKLMRISSEESTKNNQEPDQLESTVEVVLPSEPKTPTREAKIHKREARTPKQPTKSPKPESNTPNIESDDMPAGSSVDVSSSVNENEVWSLKCKDIVEQCRQKNIKSSKVVEKLNSLLVRASENQLSYVDYKQLEKILITLNRCAP